MPRKNPPARWVLPSVVNPVARKCIMLEVPDDPAHVAAFRGALLALASAYNWADDTAHTAKDVALVWRDLIDSHQDWGCDMGRDTQIRVDDICTLAWTYDNWVTFDTYDPSSCVMALIDSIVPGMIAQGITDALNDGTIDKPNGQPGPSGGPQPGGCKSYHVRLEGNSQWQLPSQMGYGDTIQVSNMKGGWTDGSLAWYCPDGARYLGPFCAEDLKTHVADDPIYPGVAHMSVIMRVGETWFDVPTTQFANNSGTTPVSVTFQANDGTLSDNGGSVEFDVEVCTATTGDWTHVFDFTASSQGWDVYPGQGGQWGGVEPHHWGGTIGGSSIVLGIAIAFDARVLTQITCNMVANCTFTGEPIVFVLRNGAIVYRYDGTTGHCANLTGEQRVNIPLVEGDKVMFQVRSDNLIDDVLFYEITVSGNGTDPF